MSETDQLEQQRQHEEEMRLTDAAATQAARPELLREQLQERFIEALGDPDVTRDDIDDDDLEGIYSTLLSRMNMLGYITDEEYQAMLPLVDNLVQRLKTEQVPQSGPGSKCVGETRYIMTGEKGVQPSNPQKMRRVDNVGTVVKMMRSLAREGKAFDGITKIQTAVESDTSGSEDGSGSGSAFTRARNLLPGGR